MSANRGAGAHPTPNLPALVTALPGDASRAPQTEFTLARQVLFLENLSVTGSVRSAASAAQVSHQTAYRARRATAAFRTAWDAALVVARASAADTLACRAIDGVEEKVFYHGEEIATRTRYSDRLLLAHLARLDRLAETPAASAFAEDWDAALVRFEDGAEYPEKAPEKTSPGPCNTRSMSYTRDEQTEEGDDGIDWEDEEVAEAEIARIEAAMEADRPADAPRLAGEGPDGDPAKDPDGLIADAQFQAFEAGVPRWWLVVPPLPAYGDGTWHYVNEEEEEEDEGEIDALEGEAEDDEGADAASGGCKDAPLSASAPESELERKCEPEPASAPEPADEPAHCDLEPSYAFRPSEGAQPFYGRTWL